MTTVHPQVAIVLDDDATFRPLVTDLIGVVGFGQAGEPFVQVQSTSVEALLALADAAQSAAAKLRVAQLDADARRAVA